MTARLRSIPTLVVGGVSSGVGKTMVACAIASALRRRGLDVRLFKSGPDYLDPTWHRLVGAPSRNLDAWLMDAASLRRSYLRGCAGGDLAIVEGAMGLFDGVEPRSLAGSTADVARQLGAPVALVVDVDAMARSVAAVAEGFAGHAADVRVGGVIANRVGSAGHAAIVRAALEQARAPGGVGIPCLGALPTRRELALPERHLGLVAAHAAPGWRGDGERARWAQAIADWAEEHLDLAALRALAAEAAPFAEDAGPEPPPGAPVTIGVARDEAFHFAYDDNLDLLRSAGATLAPFSPLHDASLPPGLDGIVIGGGYPEAHAAELAANAGMIAAIRDRARARVPIYAECGGLMYLGEELVDASGGRHRLCGLLPLATAMTPKLHAFGYREVRVVRDCLLGPAGTRYRGHEFHHSALSAPPRCPSALRIAWPGGERDDGYVSGSVFGAYVHAHWGSSPAIAANLVAACRRRGG